MTVSATASDNIGVVGVSLQVDGATIGSEDTTSPYSIVWNTTGLTDGSHTLTAVARDAAGNTGTSAAVTVTVVNGAAGPSVDVTALRRSRDGVVHGRDQRVLDDGGQRAAARVRRQRSGDRHADHA